MTVNDDKGHKESMCSRRGIYAVFGVHEGDGGACESGDVAE